MLHGCILMLHVTFLVFFFSKAPQLLVFAEVLLLNVNFSLFHLYSECQNNHNKSN